MPEPQYRVRVRDLLAHGELAPHVRIVAGAAGLDRSVTNARVQKSGLAFAGWLEGTDPERVQVLGETEAGYLDSLTSDERRKHLAALFALAPSLIVSTRDVVPHADVLAEAERTGAPVAVCARKSSLAIHALHLALDELLAARTTVHGVAVEIHGVGALLLGASGIGKSECALVLVERGHRLVADDAVLLSRVPRGDVIAAPEPLLADHLEIRGLGILNIRELYGATAVRARVRIDLVVELEKWEEGRPYDRLGLDDEMVNLLDHPIARLRMPVQPGRDMGTLLEVAARNQWLKLSGHHAARAFNERLMRGNER